ncbi:MAG: phosphoribosylformylglycinamidine synthase subunit PurL [Methanomassiliicoccales archaeon]
MVLADLMNRREAPFELFEVDVLSATDSQLEELSASMGLGLSLQEMVAIRGHFQSEGRLPTDVELESLAQAWSEHCCYKSSKVFLREHLFGTDNEEVIAKGDAGVMAFDEEYAYALRLESHNHPSAIEPYGGAATGIGGIIRDVVCMGAQPVALVDPLFFGSLDHRGELPSGVKHPRYLMDGVVAGIRDYGNRIGIPTVSGGVYLDDGYLGNCLVNVGCVGLVPRDRVVRNAVRGPEDLLVLVGGRTGRDGIHGVTFASAELDERSEEESRGAVQLGDPIMKEPLIHACLEVNDRGLISGMKDLGGGGLSCVVGEMALDGGFGAEVRLDRVPLKEEGMAPWEIWVSESQERMMLAVPRDNLDRVMETFDLWDVEATVVGEVIPEGRVRLSYMGHRVFDLDLEFLTSGPEYCRPCQAVGSARGREEQWPRIDDLGETLLALLGHQNICSREWVIRQYDHEVRGSTAIKPLQGKLGCRGHGDAAVIRPLDHTPRGLAIAVGVNPWFTALDPYGGGMASVDEACRNIAAVGGRPHSLTDCLNFGNPEKPERLWEFREAVRGMGEVCRAMDLPVPSGNVSFYNETPFGSVPPTPTVMGVGIVEEVERCVTADLKAEGDPVYLIGETAREMGGSALFRMMGGKGGEVPRVDPGSLRESIDQLLGAMAAGSVKACHDCSDGGLAVALAEMCISGDLGVSADLTTMEELPMEVQMFSESATRWVVEVDASREAEFFRSLTVPAYKIGTVGGDRLTLANHREVVSLSVEEMGETWTGTLWRLLG